MSERRLDELIEALREAARYGAIGYQSDMRREAADRLAALQAENTALREQYAVDRMQFTHAFAALRAEVTRLTAENELCFRRGWAQGWRDRYEAEDYTAILDRLRSLKPQEGAFFLLGEIAQVCALAAHEARRKETL